MGCSIDKAPVDRDPLLQDLLSLPPEEILAKIRESAQGVKVSLPQEVG